MTRMTFAGPAVLLLVGLSAEVAGAQGLNPSTGGLPPGPTVSPYLNLLRRGNSAALNYYGLVRPQFQSNAGLQALQQQITLSQNRLGPGSEAADDVLVTGHSAVYMNLGGYFQSASGALQTARQNPRPVVRGTAVPAAAPRLPRPGLR